VDIPGLLTAMGTDHRMLSWESRIVETPDSDFSAVRLEAPFAVVWDVADDEPFKMLSTSINALAGQMGDQFKYAEEQGFAGWRFENPMFEAGLFIGHGRLVLAVGEGLAARLFASIRNPPEPDASLAAADWFQRLNALRRDEPAILLSVQGPEAKTEELLQHEVARRNQAMWRQRSEAEGRGQAEPEEKLFGGKLPSVREIIETMGGEAYSLRFEEPGIVLEGAAAFPLAAEAE
jgi:hypothetical protein